MATTEIKGKELKGYSFADGIHWHWGDMEVAVIDPATSEIEWCVRKFSIPEDVVNAVRSKKPEAAGKWIIEAKRISCSATQGSVQLQVNGETLITFGDDKVMVNGKWVSKIPDEDLGRLVCSAFWHPLDNVYHYSDKAKKLFYPNMEKTPYQGMDVGDLPVPAQKIKAGQQKVKTAKRVCKCCGGSEFASNYMASLECVVNGSGKWVRYLETDQEDVEEACAEGLLSGPYTCLDCNLYGKTLAEITITDWHDPIQIRLLEREVTHGLTIGEITSILPELGDREVLPVEFEAKEHDSCALGFIAAEYAESINYEYGKIAEFVAGIMDDMSREHEDGLYDFEGIQIKLTR